MLTESHQKVSINIHLAGRMYPLTVQENQQELVRTIARELNERVGQLQLQKDHKDKQDCVAIAAMSWALDFAIAQQSQFDAKNEILIELTTENEKFTTENSNYKTQMTLLNAENLQFERDSISLNQQLTALHAILDAALQK